MIGKGQREQFTAAEAADRLGMAVDEFCRLVKDHITGGIDVPPTAVFGPTDLIVLRVLASQQPPPAPSLATEIRY